MARPVGAAVPARALVLIGFMGAGKTTLAAAIARALGLSFQDSDQVIQERTGRSIAAQFARDGEAAFREREEAVACELLAAAGPHTTIALGGGSILSERVRAALGPHLTVFLDVDAPTAWDRVRAGQGAAVTCTDRPLARDRDAFEALHRQRRGLYLGLADAILPGALSPPRLLDALPALRVLADAPAGTRLLWATSTSGDYPVLVGEDLLENGGWSDRLWPLDRSVSRSFCVTDEHVAALHPPPAAHVHGPIVMPPGESHKTLATAELVWSALLGADMTRADHLVALGGGVVGDLGGFCAATYQRGVPVVQIPTTLVAQVDAAYGGKTGVDLPDAKNYVGAYHQPAAVIVDPRLLGTLPAAELAAGWPEVIKTALIAGGDLWQRVGAGAELDADMILTCAATKLAVVAADERDAGERQALNLGHTIAHAIETVTAYSRYRHGEAVALGLLAALRLSGAQDLRAEVHDLLRSHDLPVAISHPIDVDAIVAATSRDKKRVGKAVPFVLVRRPGEVHVGCEVPPDDLRAAVSELVSS